MTQPVPNPPPSESLLLGDFTLEQPRPTRHVTVNRWLTTVALTIGIILMLITLTGVVTALTILGGLRERGTTIDLAPEPALTGCPWVESECETR